MSGQIVLAATPIGNLGDASPRLREALARADVIAAEDTRTLRHLAAALGVETVGRIVSLHDHNERERAGQLVEDALAGATVLVVSDAGMPTVSDPGHRLVKAAAAAGVEVTVIPGPSAVLGALAVSGLPTDRFSFEGFVPRKQGERTSVFGALAQESRTMVFFESPHRLASTLAAMADSWGEREASVSRELTKKFEETRRGTLGELVTWAAAETMRGEFVVCVAGAPPAVVSIPALVEQVLARVAAGDTTKEAVAELAQSAKVSRRELYSAVLAARKP